MGWAKSCTRTQSHSHTLARARVLHIERCIYTLSGLRMVARAPVSVWNASNSIIINFFSPLFPLPVVTHCTFASRSSTAALQCGLSVSRAPSQYSRVHWWMCDECERWCACVPMAHAAYGTHILKTVFYICIGAPNTAFVCCMHNFFFGSAYVLGTWMVYVENECFAFCHPYTCAQLTIIVVEALYSRARRWQLYYWKT